MFSKEIDKIEEDIDDSEDIMSDIDYVCKSCALITESLQKGCDVIQMPNGDIIISETKTVTFQYSWDKDRNKLTRIQVSNKHKKNSLHKKKDTTNLDSDDDVSEIVRQKESIYS